VHFAADPDEVHMTTRLQGSGRISCPSTGAAIQGRSSAARAIRSTVRLPHGLLLGGRAPARQLPGYLGHFMFVEKKEEKVDDGKGGHRVVTKER
jgi:type I restriction enzyme, R subunit